MIAYDKVKEFLLAVDGSFPVPLSEKVNLTEYAQKLLERADLFVDLDDSGKIQAMVAAYIRNVKDDMAYIAVVATLPEFRGRGKAGRLVQKAIEACQEENLRGVHLYTVATNGSAVKMYEKIGFVPYQIEEETRPDDLHLVYWICKED